jgi:hypothetical protein
MTTDNSIQDIMYLVNKLDKYICCIVETLESLQDED